MDTWVMGDVIMWGLCYVIPGVCQEVRIRVWIVIIGRGVINGVLGDEPHVLCGHLSYFVSTSGN